MKQRYARLAAIVGVSSPTPAGREPKACLDCTVEGRRVGEVAYILGEADCQRTLLPRGQTTAVKCDTPMAPSTAHWVMWWKRQGRGIDYRLQEIGYNSGGLHGESKNHHLVGAMEKHGLLKPLPARGYRVWARDCAIFPLLNPDRTASS